MTAEDLYNKYREDRNCFPLIEKSIEYNIVVGKEIFDKKRGDGWHEYDYYMEEFFAQITPYCGCGSDKINKCEYYLKVLNKNGDDYKFVYENELLYSFLEKEGLFEHGFSIGNCYLTKKGQFVKRFVETYLAYLYAIANKEQKNEKSKIERRIRESENIILKSLSGTSLNFM